LITKKNIRTTDRRSAFEGRLRGRKPQRMEMNVSKELMMITLVGSLELLRDRGLVTGFRI